MTMSSTTLLASAAAAARIALAEAVVLKVGQVLQAIVAATDSAGVTMLKLGSQTVEAQLPQPLPPGTTLQLQVKVGGAPPDAARRGGSCGSGSWGRGVGAANAAGGGNFGARADARAKGRARCRRYASRAGQRDNAADSRAADR